MLSLTSNTIFLLRRARRDKTGFALNVIGLAVGLAACLHMLVLAHYESRYDAWIPGSEALYRLEVGIDRPDSPPVESALSMVAAAPLLADAFPEIRGATRLSQRRMQRLSVAGSEIEIPVTHADPNFFDLFELPFRNGDPASALERPDAIVLTRAAAEALFGSRPAVGETIDFPNGKPGLVTAILEDIPPNSHLAFSLLKSTKSHEEFRGGINERRLTLNAYTYLDIEPGTDIRNLETRMSSFFEEMIGLGQRNGAFRMLTRLVKITDIHLGSAGLGQIKPPGDATAVRSFFLVAFLILIVTTINSTNLNLANFQSRYKEVAIRKAAGASQRDIGLQFLSEAALSTGLAFLLAAPAVPLMTAIQARVTCVDMDVLSAIDADLLLRVSGIFLAVVLVGGGYPALRMARTAPASLLTGSSTSATQDKGRLRTLLVALQFWIAGFLIISTLVIYGQMQLAASFDRGFDPSDRLVLRGIDRMSSTRPETFRDAVAGISGVRAASLVAPSLPLDPSLLSSIPVHLSGRESSDAQVSVVAADGRLARTLGIELLAGFWYPGETASGRKGGVIDLNTVRALGFADPEALVGQTLVMREDSGAQTDATVVGVIDTVRWGSARESFGPIVYARRETPAVALVVDIEPGAFEETLPELHKIWEGFFPGKAFRWSPLEQDYAVLSKDDRRRALVFMLFSLLAIALSCIGLYGVTLFFLQRQRREIALRRLFGAGSRRIALMLLRRHALPVVIGFLLAIPAAYLYGNAWLEHFNPRIAIGSGILATAAGLLFGLSSATIYGLVFKAARQRPDAGLRAD